MLPFKVTNPSYAEKVLDAGGAVYMDTASLQYVMPKASWITLAGSLTTLQDTVLLPLGVTPLMAAEIAATSGIDYHKTKVTSILGASDQGFSATITADPRAEGPCLRWHTDCLPTASPRRSSTATN